MTDLAPRLCAAFVISGGIAFAALRMRALSLSGAVAATAVGGLIFGLGGPFWGAALLTFFVSSTALGRWSRFVQANRRKRRKSPAVRAEKGGRRDALQVLANGGIPALCALAASLSPWLHGHALTDRTWHVVFLASLAAANGDTWATEIGTAYGRRPRMITTGKIAPRGVSGAVSRAGTTAAVFGAALLAAFALHYGLRAASIVWMAGLLGVLLDSVLGATLQAQWTDPALGVLTERRSEGSVKVRGLIWMRNDQVNALSLLAAATFALVLTINL